MNYKEYETEAAVENLGEIAAFVNGELDKADCSIAVKKRIELAVEEIFVNISSYAYTPDSGKTSLTVAVGGEPPVAAITFSDRGKPYDPLAREDPDVTLPSEKRRIGGLGIFLTKKTMDDVSYEYMDGCNILSLKKTLR